MKAFIKYLWIQLKMDLRDKGTLMHFYLVPLLFFFVMGSVLSSINPLMKTTLAATMTIFAVTMGSIMGSPTPIVKMRESGTLRAFKVNGIPGAAVLSIHAFSAFIHLLLVSVIIYIAAPVIFHSNIPNSSGYYFTVLIVFLFASIGIGLFIGVIARDQSFSTMFSMIIFLPSLLLSGIMFPASMLPKSFMWLGRIFPATHALQSFYGLAYQTKTDINANLSICIVTMVGVFMFILSIWQFANIGRN
ncbi:ABC transporter permease [Clostridium sp. Mt-5]|uniref:Transport permease protein n=1 Tax=Clostridium moutaii TaxID=3240932 RepID=A0ABV4BW54_9CLOT